MKERRRYQRKPHSVAMSNYGDKDTPDDVFFAVMSGKLFLLTEHIKVDGFRFDGSGKSFQTASVEHTKNNGGSWFAIGSPGPKELNRNPVHELTGQKTIGHANIRDGHSHTRHLTNPAESEGVKFSQSGAAWFDGQPRDKMLGDKGPAALGSKSNARKAASAMIAKIPLPLARYIARTYKP